jgi:sigma-E factor negative regulatory protein RseB
MARLGLVFVLLVLSALPGLAPAAEPGLALLQAVSEAYRSENFRGRFIYVRGNRMDSMQVVRARIEGVEYERLSHLDDTAAEVFRRGDDVVCIHPDARVTRLDSAGRAGPFRQFAAISAAIAEHYTVSAPEAARVAGRSADLVSVAPRDAHRLGYRFWIDRETKLLLRYEVLGRRGKVLEAVGFIELETGITAPRELFEPPAGSEANVTRVQPAGETAVVPVTPSWLPPGFHLQATETQQPAGDGPPVTALRYSDGLSSITVFVEPAGADARPVSRQVGPTVMVGGVLDSGEPGRFLVTLVGEVPPQTAVKIVGSTRHERGRPVVDRSRPFPPPPVDDDEGDAP